MTAGGISIGRALIAGICLFVSARSLAQDPNLASVSGSGNQSEDAYRVHEESQSLKREVLELDRDLRVLEENTLYPVASRFTVFIATDTAIFFRLESVRLLLDGTEVAHYDYSKLEERALIRGGAHRLLVGSAPSGKHLLVAFMSGVNLKNNKPYRRGVSLDFEQGSKPQIIELRVSDSGGLQQAQFTGRVLP